MKNLLHKNSLKYIVVIVLLAVIFIITLFAYLKNHSQKSYVVNTIEKTSDENTKEYLESGREVVSTTYYKMSDGTWKTDTHSYQYCLEVVGTPNNADEAITYIVLSNNKELTFEQVWQASFSSDSRHKISQDEAVVVGFKLGSTKTMPPVEVVSQHLEAMRTNDWKGWLATMTEEKQTGFLDPDIFKHLLKLEVHEVYQMTDGEEVQRQKQALLESDRAEAVAGSAENIAFVHADFSVEYDPAKSPFSDRNKWVYTLFRADEEAPWLISDWGVGHFTIPPQ